MDAQQDINARLAFEDNRRRRLANLRSKLNRPGLENLAAMMGKSDRLERHPDGRYVAGSVEMEWSQWREAWTRAIASQGGGLAIVDETARERLVHNGGPREVR